MSEPATCLEIALESQDARLIAGALRLSVKARGAARVARDGGLDLEALTSALSGDGQARAMAFLGVLRGLGLRVKLMPMPTMGSPVDSAK